MSASAISGSRGGPQMIFERVSQRVNASSSIQCTFKGKRVDANLYNLSLDGCMLDVPDLCLDSGDLLTVNFMDELSQNGEVIWSRAGNIGLQFDEPLHVAVVRHFALTPTATSITRLQPSDRFGRVLPGWGQASPL